MKHKNLLIDILSSTLFLFIIFVFLTIISLLSSCNTIKRYKESVKIDSIFIKTDTIYKESIKIIEKIKDTTVYINIKNDTIKIQDTIYINKDNIPYIKPIKIKQGIITVEAKMIKGNIDIIAYISDSIQYKYQNHSTSIETNKNTTVSNIENKTKIQLDKNYRKKNNNYYLYIISALFIFILGFIVTNKSK